MLRFALRASLAVLTISAIAAAQAPPSTQVSEIPDNFVVPTAQNDYVRRTEMIAMRDGVKLYTVIVIPKGAKNAPIVLTRTPYNAKERASNDNPSIYALLSETDQDFAQAGYIRVFQDIRGKYGSEGG